MRIAIDDFGTGYSSLAYLQRFPVDALKIDRSFISQLAENPEGEALIRTLVQLGKALSIETLAEGIEHSQRARAPAGGGLRHRPGLPVRAAAGGRRGGAVPAGLAAPAARGAPGASLGATWRRQACRGEPVDRHARALTAAWRSRPRTHQRPGCGPVKTLPGRKCEIGWGTRTSGPPIETWLLQPCSGF